MMKKTLLLAAVMATVLSSCSKNEVSINETDSANAINFGTYVGTSTKATAKTAFESGDSFNVFAYYTEATAYASATGATPNFMFNQEVTASGTETLTWTYSPIKYWPNSVTSDNEDGKISFFAYWKGAALTEDEVTDTEEPTIDLVETDGTTTLTNESTTDPCIKYVLDQTAAVDLMWAVSSEDGDGEGLPHIDLTKQATTDDITFHFMHALSKVGFTVALGDDIISESSDDNNTTVTITSIEFGGTLDTEDSEKDLTSDLYSEGVLNLNNTTVSVANWISTLYGDTRTQLLLETVDFVDSSSDGTFDSGIFKKTPNTETADAVAFTGTIKNDDDKYFMIIPQDFSTDKTQMRIKYNVTTADASLTDKTSSIDNIYVADVKTKFESGKAYTFAITIGLNTVKVTSSIEGWDETTESVEIATNNGTEVTETASGD